MCPLEEETTTCPTDQLLPDLLDTMESLVNQLAAARNEDDILDLLATVRVFVFAFRGRMGRRRAAATADFSARLAQKEPEDLADFSARLAEKKEEEEDMAGMITGLVAGWEEGRRAEEAVLHQEDTTEDAVRINLSGGRSFPLKQAYIFSGGGGGRRRGFKCCFLECYTVDNCWSDGHFFCTCWVFKSYSKES